MVLKHGSKMIFIGDSITDSGKNIDVEQLGNGYVRNIRDYYALTAPELDLKMINKGISGNRIDDLAARWQEDVIQLQPDIVSISIGINDVWRQLDQVGMNQIYPDTFEEIYIDLLESVKAQTNAAIIIMEPTIIEEDLHSRGNELLLPYVEITRKLAEQYHAKLVPTNEAFRKYLQKKPSVKLTTDGVHMTSTGNLLMTKTWIHAISK